MLNKLITPVYVIRILLKMGQLVIVHLHLFLTFTLQVVHAMDIYSNKYVSNAHFYVKHVREVDLIVIHFHYIFISYLPFLF